MDAIQLLIRQHRALERTMKAVLDSEDATLRGDGFKQLADELTMHMTSEERVFYPAVRARRTEDILLESLEEHLSLKRLLADLLEIAAGDEGFEPKFKVLQEQSEHHHGEEEEHLFPKVEKLLDADQREVLGREMLALQQRMIDEGEPRDAVAAQTEQAAPLGATRR
jgi:hemerythrin superfamily protein